jgi:hypothetical protein
MVLIKNNKTKKYRGGFKNIDTVLEKIRLYVNSIIENNRHFRGNSKMKGAGLLDFTKSMGNMDPKSLGGLDLTSMAGLDPKSMGGLDLKSMAGLDPKSMGGLDLKSMAGLDLNSPGGLNSNPMAAVNINSLMGPEVLGAVNNIMFTYIEDVSQILCENGIDFDKLLNSTSRDLAGKGIHLKLLIVQMVAHLKTILEYFGYGQLIPMDINKLAEMFIKMLKEKGTYKCGIRSQPVEDLVNLNAPYKSKNGNNVKQLINAGLGLDIGGNSSFAKTIITSQENYAKDVLPDAPVKKGGKRRKNTKRRSNK